MPQRTPASVCLQSVAPYGETWPVDQRDCQRDIDGLVATYEKRGSRRNHFSISCGDNERAPFFRVLLSYVEVGFPIFEDDLACIVIVSDPNTAIGVELDDRAVSQ